jgi:hypothetical protein
MRLARSNAARRAIALRHCAERLREKNSHKAQTKANSVYEERAAAGRHSGYQLLPGGDKPLWAIELFYGLLPLVE